MTYIYILVFITLLVLASYYEHENGNSKAMIQYICLNFLILFFGLHSNVGDDYAVYQSFYHNPSFDEAIVYGPVFSALCYSFSYFNLPFQCLIFFISAITNILLVRFFMQLNYNLPFVVAIFFALGGIINEIDFIRNILGLAFFVNSITYIHTRDSKKFFLLNIIGFLCHYSSVLYIPLYWIGRKVIGIQNLIILFSIGLVLSPLYIPYSHFLPHIEEWRSALYIEHAYKYLDQFQGIRIRFSFGTIERVTTAAFVCVFHKKLTQDVYGRTAIWAFVFYFLCYTCLSNYAVLATRLANLYIFSYWILVPLFIKNIPNKKIKICYISFLFVYMLFRLISISLMPQWNYQLCF